MLFDADSKKITGPVDFDLASISHPAEDLLAEAVLTGGCDGVDVTSLSDEREALLTARAFDMAARNRGLLRPSNVPDVCAMGMLVQLLEQLAPSKLTRERFLKRKTADEIAVARQSAREALEKTLAELM
ncbi:hypothetical protein B0T25DRAFT_574670 [Lasiosphaeria hispida]|uniref:Uncharacterized protein n=1 Tax=Lasiosphaeria hispida TaxID=260671 RepID=A0AAJ0M7S5_9PEZI|nr:hypothetical protein B0T25DRAFT_574670 [Lasiosphaeria hispida]